MAHKTCVPSFFVKVQNQHYRLVLIISSNISNKQNGDYYIFYDTGLPIINATYLSKSRHYILLISFFAYVYGLNNDNTMVIEQLKEFTETDFKNLKELMSQLSEGIVLEKSDLERVIGDNNCSFYVIRNTDGSIIASATLAIFNSPSSKKASIEDVIVSKEYCGQHIGLKIVDHLISKAKKHSPIEAQLTSKPKRIKANILYQSLGFEKKETNFYRMVLN